jgi:hypothetical protein
VLRALLDVFSCLLPDALSRLVSAPVLSALQTSLLLSLRCL